MVEGTAKVTIDNGELVCETNLSTFLLVLFTAWKTQQTGAYPD